MRGYPLVLSLALSAILPCTALDVIRDAAGQPLVPYLARFTLNHRDETGQAPAVPSDQIYRLTHHLPIRSPSLSPGPAEARQRPTRLLQPIFLVGADPPSLAWLEANRERLKHMGAIGMLVQAESEAEIQQAMGAAQGLPLIPASAEVFATALGIRHYPVLITGEGIEP